MTTQNALLTEADTCREFVTPGLLEAGWGVSPHAIGEQRSFTNGRIIEIDHTNGTERELDRYVTHDEMFTRLIHDHI